MKAWETIRLLLACQHAYERLTKISSTREEQKRRFAVSQDTMQKMNIKIQLLDADISSIGEDEKVKEAKIADLQTQKSNLKEELAKARSNTRYQEISQKIDQ